MRSSTSSKLSFKVDQGLGFKVSGLKVSHLEFVLERAWYRSPEFSERASFGWGSGKQLITHVPLQLQNSYSPP